MRGFIFTLLVSVAVLTLVMASRGTEATPPPTSAFDVYAVAMDMDPSAPVANAWNSIGGGAPDIQAGDIQSSASVPIGGTVTFDVVIDSLPGVFDATNDDSPVGEAGGDCSNAIDDDGDGVVNDGCGVVGVVSEAGFPCGNAVDDDGDGLVNDGCRKAGANPSCGDAGDEDDVDCYDSTTVSGGVGMFGYYLTLHYNGGVAGIAGYRSGNVARGGSPAFVADSDAFLHSHSPSTSVYQSNSTPQPSFASPNVTGSFAIENLWGLSTEVGSGRLLTVQMKCLAAGTTTITMDDPLGYVPDHASVFFADPDPGGVHLVANEFEASLTCTGSGPTVTPTPPPGQDLDGDGVLNGVDNCPSVPNPNQFNDDIDTYGNDCDNCPSQNNQDQADSDGDSRGDVCDNCPTMANSNQANSDNDARGNLCDNCPTKSNSTQTNSDEDTFGDACDNCPTVPNQDQANGDGDAVGSACEPAHCVAVPNWWVSPGPIDDPDCDGFTTEIESAVDILSDPNDSCANTATANDEDDDKWPADFTDNQVVNTLDLTGYANRLGAIPVTALDRRHDLNQNNVINTLDLTPYATMLGRTCVPPP